MRRLYLVVSCALLFSLYSTTIGFAHSSLSELGIGPLQQLNNKMRILLALNPEQYENIKGLNYSYWTERQQIIETPKRIAAKTAVLAQWDQWQIALSDALSDIQFSRFLQWQASVDILGNRPF